MRWMALRIYANQVAHHDALQTFDCIIKVRTEWYTNRWNRSHQGQWVNGWVQS